MKLRFMIYLFVFLVLVGFVSAEVRLIVGSENGIIYRKCLDGGRYLSWIVDDNLNVTWKNTQYGKMLCSIDGVGSCSEGENFWMFYVLEDEEFVLSSIGLDKAEVSDGETYLLYFGGFSEKVYLEYEFDCDDSLENTVVVNNKTNNGLVIVCIVVLLLVGIMLVLRKIIKD